MPFFVTRSLNRANRVIAPSAFTGGNTISTAQYLIVTLCLSFLCACSAQRWQHTRTGIYSDNPRVERLWMQDTNICERERSIFLAGRMPGAQNVFDRAIVKAGGEVTWKDCMKLRGWNLVEG